MDHTDTRSRTMAGSLFAAPAGQGTATRAVAQRVLTLERANLLTQAPEHLDPVHGGLVVCGKGGPARLRELRSSFDGVLAEDRAAYEKGVADPEAPFSLPEDVLFGDDLNSVLQEQIDRGATFATTPTRYVRAGDLASLQAILRETKRLRRDDVVVTLPLSVDWLRAQARSPLIDVIGAFEHPVALILGGQYDPLTRFTAAPQNLRALLAEVPGTGLWRTDLAGFDALAHGAGFAAIGAGGSLRHLVPAGERAETSGPPGPHYPSVLIPDLMRFSTAKFLADAYANTTPPRCHCSRCEGAYLDSFFGLTDQVRAAAHAHNNATWNSWLPGLLEQPTLADRQRWWRTRCRYAVDAHAVENTRIGLPGRFEPPRSLKKWAVLPTDADTAENHETAAPGQASCR